MRLEKILLLTLLLLPGFGVVAQQSVNGAGGQASGSGGTASYSVGQVVYTSASGSGGQINQGVQQPYEFYIISAVVHRDINLEMSVYPNPAQFVVNLKIDNAALLSEGLYGTLFDLSGAQVSVNPVNGQLTQIPVDHLAAGAYILRVTNRDGAEMQSFKIIKH